jgi:hypothetical protein
MRRPDVSLIYRALLGLHPKSFRQEFGADMLWIFEEEYKQGNARYLLFDVSLSLLRQRCRVQSDPGQLSIASGAVITGPGIEPVRFFQAAISVTMILFSLVQVAAHSSRHWPCIRWADHTSCYTITLQAPSHAEIVLGAAQ